MNTPPTASQPFDPRRRLRELLSIPERDRTDEQWDEIVELEIQLAPGNRIGPAGGPPMKNGPSPSGNNAQQPRKHRPNKNAGGAGGGGGGGGGGGRRPPKANKPPRDPSAT